MRFPLGTHEDLRSFEREIVALVEASSLQRAEYLVGEAIEQAGSDQLRAARDMREPAPSIHGWQALVADLVEADARLSARTGRPASLAILSLVNRALLSGGFIDRLEIERKVFAAFETRDNGRIAPDRDAGYESPDLGTRATVFVTGLEPLMAVQQHPWPSAGTALHALHQFKVDQLLSGLLLVVRFHRLIERTLESPGLPPSLHLLVEMDRADWPMEAGVHRLGPQARRHIPPRSERVEMNAAPEILAERPAERRARHQAKIDGSIAEARELYRLVRMFPFYRFASRDKVAELLTARMKSWCHARDLPRDGVSWRMSKPAFEGLLRQLAETHGVDVEEALHTQHVDDLHARWLAAAQRLDFNLGSAPLSLFELSLAAALHRGGPIVQDRWVHARPYSAA